MRYTLTLAVLVSIAIAVTGKAETIPSDGIIITAAGSYVNYTQDNGAPYGGLTKLGDGTATITSGLFACPINLEAGTLNLPNVSVVNAGKDGAVSLYGNSVLNASGSISRAVDVALGGGFDQPTINATGSLSLGDLSSSTGFRLVGDNGVDQFTWGTLNVGTHTVGLSSGGYADLVYATVAGGRLGSMNGIHFQSGGSLSGYGQINGYVRFGEPDGPSGVDVNGVSNSQRLVFRDTVQGSFNSESFTTYSGLLRTGFSPTTAYSQASDKGDFTMSLDGKDSPYVKTYSAYVPGTPLTVRYKGDYAEVNRISGYSRFYLFSADPNPTTAVKSNFTGKLQLQGRTTYANTYTSGDIFVLLQSLNYNKPTGTRSNTGADPTPNTYLGNLANYGGGFNVVWDAATTDSRLINKAITQIARRDGGLAVMISDAASTALPQGWTASNLLSGTVQSPLSKSFAFDVSGVNSVAADVRGIGNGLGMFNGNWAYFDATNANVAADQVTEMIFQERTNAKFAGMKINGGTGTFSLFRSDNGLIWDSLGAIGAGQESDFLTYTVGTGGAWTGTGITGGTDYFKLVYGQGSSLDSVGLVFDREGAASFTMSAVAVPEPATLALLGMGVLGLRGFGRRWRKTA